MKKRLPKATIETKKKRLEEVMELRGEGQMRFQVLPILMARWGMSEKGVQMYWDASNKIIKEGFTDEDLITSYKHIRDKHGDKNPAIAVKCNDSIAKLKKGGFNAPTQNQIIIKFDDEEGELKSN